MKSKFNSQKKIKIKLFISILIITFVSIVSIEGKIYTKCEFARKMDSAGIPRKDLPDWVCLVQHTSVFNTCMKEKGGYGIFQIASLFWCIEGSPGKDCNIDCNS